MAEEICGNVSIAVWPVAAARRQGPCSGNGRCELGRCVCDAGWTGSSDLFNTKGVDCQNSEVGLIALWAVVLVVSTVIWVWTLPAVIARVQQYRTIRDRRKAARQRSIPPWRSPMIMSVVFFELVAVPFATGLVVWRFAYPSQRIGVDAAPTVFFFVACLGFYAAVMCFQPFLLLMLMRTNNTLKALAPVVWVFAWFNFTVSVGAAAIPFVTLVLSDGLDLVARYCYTAYFTANSVVFLSYALQAVNIMYRVKVLLRKEMPGADERRRHTQMVRQALESLQTQFLIQALLVSAVCATFAFVPFLFNKMDYFVAFLWFSGTFVWKFFMFTAVPRANKRMGIVPARLGVGAGGGRAEQPHLKDEDALLTSWQGLPPEDADDATLSDATY